MFITEQVLITLKSFRKNLENAKFLDLEIRSDIFYHFSYFLLLIKHQRIFL